MTDRRHAWARALHKGQPVLACDRDGCLIVWWSDRREPKSACEGEDRPEVNPAAEFVRALYTKEMAT